MKLTQLAVLIVSLGMAAGAMAQGTPAAPSQGQQGSILAQTDTSAQQPVQNETAGAADSGVGSGAAAGISTQAVVIGAVVLGGIAAAAASGGGGGGGGGSSTPTHH